MYISFTPADTLSQLLKWGKVANQTLLQHQEYVLETFKHRSTSLLFKIRVTRNINLENYFGIRPEI